MVKDGLTQLKKFSKMIAVVMQLLQQALDFLVATPLVFICQTTLEKYIQATNLSTVSVMLSLSQCVDLSPLLVEHI